MYNRSPHSAIDLITPYEKFLNKEPNLEQVKLFGSRCEVLKEFLPRGQKANSRTETQFLVGYTSTGYVVFNPKTGKTSEVCNVIIYQQELYKQFYPGEYDNLKLSFESPENNLVEPLSHVLAGGDDEIQSNSPVLTDNVTIPSSCAAACTCDKCQPNTQEIELAVDWDDDPSSSQSQNNTDVIQCKASFLDSYATLNVNNSLGTCDKDFNFWIELPLTYDQAVSPSYVNVWMKAIDKERQALLKHNVWTPVPRTSSIKSIPVKWIFTQKADGTPKARLVVVGCRDPETYVKDDTASPTASVSSFRWLLIHAVHNKWDIVQLDITNAFLHGIIDREKYINVPPGFDIDAKKYVCKLNRALYGLALSPICWFNTLDKL